MENVFIRIHRAELFESFVLQLDYNWDLKRPADVERIKQWKDIFDNAYGDVSSKRVGVDNSDSYIKCREYICKHW